MASQNISFETIPSSIRVPGRYIEFNTKLAVRNLPTNQQQAIIIAPMVWRPMGAPGPQQFDNTVMRIYSDTEAGEKFGFGSWAHLMVRQAINNNRYINLSVIGVPDGFSLIAASATINIATAPLNAGRIVINIGLAEYAIAVDANENQGLIASRIVTLINSDPDCLVTAHNELGGLVVTAKNKGVIGNDIYLNIETQSGAQVSSHPSLIGGQGSADISQCLSNIAGTHYHVYISAFSDDANLKKLSNHIEYVSNAIEKRGGVVVAGWRGSLATGTTLTSKLNDGRMTVAWYKGAIAANAIIAAGYGAVIAGEEDPAMPLNTLEVKGLDLIHPSKWPLFMECDTALYNGLTPLTIVNNRVQILRAISTYTKNVTGTDDPALLDITTIRTLDYTRMSVDQRLALRFPRAKLSDRTCPKVRSEIFDVLLLLEELEILEKVMENKDKIIVERDLQDANTVNCKIPADVVNGLHKIQAVIDLYL